MDLEAGEDALGSSTVDFRLSHRSSDSSPSSSTIGMICKFVTRIRELDSNSRIGFNTVGEFSDDNRSGIDHSLHRISAICNRRRQIIGLTCRVGRAISGSAEIVRDLVEGGGSILVIRPPGGGKTTLIREIARILADERKKRVVIIDTSNEIGGDGDVPHSGIGRARRMQVPNVNMQHNVVIMDVFSTPCGSPEVQIWVGCVGWVMGLNRLSTQRQQPTPAPRVAGDSHNGQPSSLEDLSSDEKTLTREELQEQEAQRRSKLVYELMIASHSINFEAPLGGRLQRDVVLYLGQRRYLLNMDCRSKGYVLLSRTLETSAHGSRGWCRKLVAVSGDSGVVQNSKGIDIPALLEHNKKTGCIMGFEGAGEMNGDELLVFKCDVLVPCTSGGVITSRENAGDDE
ncbi:hypothetical protein M8C21_013602, partial [Ambrosia artemisiifolia]